MKIVHIGLATSMQENDHISELRLMGHKVHVPSIRGGIDKTVRRILDADEVHIWDLSSEFYLGMVVLYYIYGKGHNVHYAVRIYCRPTRPIAVQLIKAGATSHE